MQIYLPLMTVGLVPITVSIILYYLNKRVFKDLNYWVKQVVFGIIFGGIAILGTEFSVQINGVGMNVRDAAPLCAGLFFGWPAALISGFIGGVERWLCVYWGGGQLTRIACSLATAFSGCLAAIFRALIFDNKNAKPVYSFAIGVVAETMHMLLVILTNLDDVSTAFNVVKLCTIPMVSAVALSVGITSLFVYLIDKKFDEVKKNPIIDISTHFQRRLLILVTISFLLTNGFVIVLQNNLSSDQTNQLLIYTLQDTVAEVKEASDNHLTEIAQTVCNEIEILEDDDVEVSNSMLTKIVEKYNISGIAVVDKNNIIVYSSDKDYLNFDMNSSESGKQFVEAFKNSNTQTFVQDFNMSNDIDGVSIRYAACRNSYGGYVLTACTSKQITENTIETLELLAHNTRIGETGSMIIATANDQKIVCDLDDSLVDKTLNEVGLVLDTNTAIVGSRYRAIINGVDEYYSYYVVDNYIVIVMQTTEEATFNEYLSTYLLTFVEISVFAGIFIIVYFLIKGSVVENVNTINDDLKKITEGNLDVVVNVRDTMEFATLSDHINTTVDKLKELISDAEKRMEDELNYAAEIQRSSLPVNFPDQKEVDLYASMTPAKEVGGDFYDFYFLNKDKLCILIADVSGKGVPASLFMMRAKTQIKSYAEYGFEVNDIFTDSNFNLTEGNDAGLFVTSWIGILDLKTGHLSYANAGHNPPLIRKPDGSYEYLKQQAGFVLGGMEGIAYKKYEMDLPEGSSIFIYTDGLTEAQNIDEELYGEDRLKNSIDKCAGLDSKTICENVIRDIRQFQGEANQFDDMTMLHLNFKEKLK